MSDEPLIQLQDVTKVFYADDLETHALDRVHLEVREGEFISISGPSGCGKSTLLAIVGLLDAPSAGRYLLRGQDTAGLPAAARAQLRNERVGFIFQAFNLIGDLNILDNVMLPLSYRRNMDPAARRAAAIAALDRVGMAHRLNHLPAQLSGGQQQRVAVARALAGAPEILLADEPTGNLDSRNGEVVMDLLRELHRDGATICMVTHDPRYADLADRQVRLFDGRVVGEDTVVELPVRRTAAR